MSLSGVYLGLRPENTPRRREAAADPGPPVLGDRQRPAAPHASERAGAGRDLGGGDRDDDLPPRLEAPGDLLAVGRGVDRLEAD